MLNYMNTAAEHRYAEFQEKPKGAGLFDCKSVLLYRFLGSYVVPFPSRL